MAILVPYAALAQPGGLRTGVTVTEGKERTTATKTGVFLLWLGVGLGSLVLLVAVAAFVALNLGNNEPSRASVAGPGTSNPNDEASKVGVSPNDVFEQTVQIVGLGANGEILCRASGTIVTPAGQVLTSARVATPSEKCDFETIGVAVVTAREAKPVLAYEAALLSTDAALDIALMRIARNISDGSELTEQFSAPTLGNSDNVDKSDEIELLGFPNTDDASRRTLKTQVTGFAERSGVPEGRLLQTDSEAVAGFAGATAIDSSGRIIGVVGSSSFEEDLDCLDLSEPSAEPESETNCVGGGRPVNVIRPINLALPLVEEAEGSLPIEIQSSPPNEDLPQLQFSRPRFTVGTSAKPSDAGIKTAKAGVETLCLSVDWEGMQQGSSWDAIWYRDGLALPEYSLRNETWTLNEAGEDFWICAGEDETSGLPAGLYEIGFFIDGENIFAEGFELSEDARPVHKVTWTNDVEGDTDICSLAINPKGSGPVGLNELPDGERIEPGQSVTVEVAEGTIVVAADDCDGGRLAIQLDGLLVDGPKDYSIGIG